MVCGVHAMSAPGAWWLYPWLALWWAGIFAGSLTVGRWLLRRLGLAPDSGGAEWVLGTGLGLVLLSYLAFAASALHLLSVGFLLGLSALWLVLALLGFRVGRRARGGEAPRGIAGFGWLAIIILALTAGMNLLPVLTPAVDWDGVAYHLALPKIYLAAGGFVFRPDIFHNLFPQFTEMLFLPGLLFPAGIAAKAVHYGLGLLAAGAVYAAARKSGLRTAAWFAAAVFYVQFLVQVESGTAFIDLASAAYAGLALVAFQHSWDRQADSRRWLYLAVFLAGVCAAIKWHGVVILALAGGWALLYIWTDRPGRALEKLRTLALAAGWGLLPVAPYLLRAWLQGGNPVWPLGFNWFGGHDWDADLARRSTAIVANFAGVHRGWEGLIRLPLDLAMHGDQFGVGGPQLRWPLLGLVWTGLAWLLVKLSRRGASHSKPDLRLAYLPAALALYGAFWHFTSPQVRFLLVLFPVVFWLAACALSDVWRAGRVGKVAAVIGGLLLVAVHPPVHRETWEQVRMIAGAIRPQEFIARRLDNYPACEFLNRQDAEGGRVLLFGENRGFYLNGEYLWGDPQFQKVVDYMTLGTPDRLLGCLRELGVTRVMYRTDLYPPEYLEPGTVKLMQAALAQAGAREYYDGKVAVYKLKE
jgi:hypothetical protein